MSTRRGMRSWASLTIQATASGCALTGTLNVQSELASSFPVITSASAPASNLIFSTAHHAMRRSSPFSTAMPGAPTRIGDSLLVPIQIVMPMITAPAAIR